MKTSYVKLFLMIALFSCEKDDLKDSGLLIGVWNLDSAYFKLENEVNYYPESLEKQVSIELTDSSIAILNGYCNKGFVNYFLDDKSITFTDVSMTELICFDDEGTWEEYLYELSYITTYQLEGFKLVLVSEANIDLYLSKDN